MMVPMGRIHHTAFALTIAAAAVGAAALASAGTAERPLARWSFEYGVDEWRAAGSPLSWSKLKARDGGWSLKLGVGFPRPSSVCRAISVDVDLVGRIDYHVYVPADAPVGIKTLLFLKDKDGLWFQHFSEQALRPGVWNEVRVEIGALSPYLRPSGHHRLWNTVAARRMNEMGVKFFCDQEYSGSLYLDRVLAWRTTPNSPPLRVLNLRENSLEVGRYEKFEVSFDLSRNITNPFDPEQISIDATFRDPAGKTATVPAFYYQNFVRRLNNNREELVPVGSGTWKVRFAPVAVGAHTYSLTVRHHPDRKAHGAATELTTGTRAFQCVASESRGFVRVSKKDPRYFEFDNGEWFYPIGHNLHSPSDDTPRAVGIQRAIGADVLPDRGTFSYDDLFAKMAKNGENFAEVWMCSWWLGLEWFKDWKHYNGLTSYNLHNAWKLDHLLALADRHDLYLHLVIDNHGKASTWCDPEWEDNPYNRLNGGFLAGPQEFFRNPIAKAIYKKKLRYIIARWGYATRVAGFELWSEVDLVGDSYSFHSDAATSAPKVQWHDEISRYLDQLDPWGHAVTTHFSTSYGRIKPSIVSLPGIDYVVTDAYRGSGKSIIGLIVASAKAFNSYGKPGMVTEYGGSPFGSRIPNLRSDLHHGLWSTYMTHTAGTPLLWWFQFIESDDLYWNFKALAAYHAGEDRRAQGFEPAAATFAKGGKGLGTLALQNPTKAYAWVYDAAAAVQMPKLKKAVVHKGVSVQLKGLKAGSYRIEVWDTHTGAIIDTLKLPAKGGVLTIPLPPFRIDCALKVKPAS